MQYGGDFSVVIYFSLFIAFLIVVLSYYDRFMTMPADPKNPQNYKIVSNGIYYKILMKSKKKGWVYMPHFLDQGEHYGDEMFHTKKEAQGHIDREILRAKGYKEV